MVLVLLVCKWREVRHHANICPDWCCNISRLPVQIVDLAFYYLAMLGQVGKYSPDFYIIFENIFGAPKIFELCADILLLRGNFYYCAEIYIVAQKFILLRGNFYCCAEIYIVVPTNILLLPRKFLVARISFCCPENFLLAPRICFWSRADFLFPTILGMPGCHNNVND